MSLSTALTRGFVEEMLAIKVAEEQSQAQKEDDGTVSFPSAVRAVGNMALGGIAYAVGSSAVRLAEPKIRQLLSNVHDPSKLKIIGQVVGISAAAGSLALADAIARNARMVRESSKPNG